MLETENKSCTNGTAVEVNENSQAEVQPPAPLNENNVVELVQPAVCQIAPSVDAQQQQQQPQQLEKDANANTKEPAEANNNDSVTVTQLQDEILKRTSERDDFRKKLEETERKLSTLQAAQNSLINGSANGSDDAGLRRELETLKTTLNQTKLVLNDRDRRVASQENQISALCKQVSSLKEVVAITKDMLNIRNMEVKHLQEDVDKMEQKITAERDRHNAMLDKMDAAVRLNADLKKEYMTQLQLFQDLRGKYEEKVVLLNEENKALETAVQAQPAQ